MMRYINGRIYFTFTLLYEARYDPTSREGVLTEGVFDRWLVGHRAAPVTNDCRPGSGADGDDAWRVKSHTLRTYTRDKKVG